MSGDPAPSLAVDISDHSIEVMQMTTEQEVLRFGRTDLPKGVVQGGVIEKPDTLAQQLERTIEAMRPNLPKGGHRPKKAVTCLPETVTYSRAFQVPQMMSESQLVGRVYHELTTSVPYESTELVWDVRHEPWGSGEYVICVAAPAAIVDVYQNVFSKLDIRDLSIESALLSLARSLGLVRSNVTPQSLSLILDAGAHTMDIGVFTSNGLLLGSYSIPFGAETLIREMAVRSNMSAAQVRDVWVGSGVTGGGAISSSLISQMLTPSMEKIRRIIEHSQGQHEVECTEIILVGGMSLTPGISEYFDSALSIRTRVGEPLKQIVHRNLLGSRQAVLYAQVIGLGLVSSSEKTSEVNLAHTEESSDPPEGASSLRAKLFNLLASGG
jgi:Tfp pilus assembly PilM family ATPase